MNSRATHRLGAAKTLRTQPGQCGSLHPMPLAPTSLGRLLDGRFHRRGSRTQNTEASCHLDTGIGYSIPGGADMPPKHTHIHSVTYRKRCSMSMAHQAPHPSLNPGQRRLQPCHHFHPANCFQVYVNTMETRGLTQEDMQRNNLT